MEGIVDLTNIITNLTPKYTVFTMHCLLFYFRKKYVKSCRIRHTYGDDDEDDPCNEEEAVMLTETAIADESARPPPVLQPVSAPKGASLEVGGKGCKWCGSKTHMRKSYRDCPFNKKE